MELGVNEVRVDASGMGYGVIEPLWELCKFRYQIVEVLGGGNSPDRRAFLNTRAYQYSELRRCAFQGTVDLDPADEQLLEELEGVIYDFADASSGGGLKIESKESMKRRGVKSPDFADAAWYAFMDLGDPDDILYGRGPGTIVKANLEDYQPSGFYGSYIW
jgi:hypothetical protein